MRIDVVWWNCFECFFFGALFVLLCECGVICWQVYRRGKETDGRHY